MQGEVRQQDQKSALHHRQDLTDDPHVWARCPQQEHVMAKYGEKAKEKVGAAMHERKAGTLKSGKSGKKVTSKKQAIAIGLSEARKEGGKAPKAKNSKR
jgi:hypothetical protein